MNRYSLALLALLCCAPEASAQSTVLAPSRFIDWSQAGVVGGIPNRTAICANLSPGATIAQINSAIAACPGGQVVFLNAGTYNLGSGGIVFNNKSNVTLRGAGPDRTFLNFTSEYGCGGFTSADVCFIDGSNQYADRPPTNSATWSAGYAKGGTVVTLSNTSNLQVGGLLTLDQLWDTADTGDVYVCATGNCCIGCNQPGRPQRPQQQIVTVTAINGNNVSISPGLYMPNWRSPRSPGAWWTGQQPVQSSGIEDLSMNHSGTSAFAGITFYNAKNCWVKNVRSLYSNSHHVLFFESAHITVRDSYFYATRNAASQSYGTGAYTASDILVENNIYDQIPSPLMSEVCAGCVFAYNYTINETRGDNPSWGMGSAITHAPENSYILFEGNDGFGFQLDNYHGTAHFVTGFRNRWSGYFAGKSEQTVPIHNYSFSRYTNIVGNVLGSAGYHTNYQSRFGFESANISTCYHSIYALGWGGNCESSSDPANDSMVASTIMRWGNYDVVNASSRFVASEVPSGLAAYANAVPATQSLPASFYLSGKPGWFGAIAWPAIGPDVSGGAVTGLAGHVHKIPARVCYETSPKVSGILTYNGATCYGASGPPPPAPGAPTNLKILGAALVFVPVLGRLLRRATRA